MHALAFDFIDSEIDSFGQHILVYSRTILRDIKGERENEFKKVVSTADGTCRCYLLLGQILSNYKIVHSQPPTVKTQSNKISFAAKSIIASQFLLVAMTSLISFSVHLQLQSSAKRIFILLLTVRQPSVCCKQASTQK